LKKDFKNLLTLSKKEYLLVGAIFVAVLLILLYTLYSPNQFDDETVPTVEISRGSNFNDVVDTLYHKKIIPNKLGIRLAAFIYDAEKKIKAGRYTIPEGLNYFQLVELFINGAPQAEILVTIPEGIWQNDLASLLNSKLGIDSSYFMKLSKNMNYINSLDLPANVTNLEGYLLPETYYFYANSTVEEIIKKLVTEKKKFIAGKLERRMQELKLTLNETLTLASIIDGESNIIGEFKTISGVYHNRLRIKMPLQADPTIQYLIRDKRKNRILYKDLEINSKYNTYKYAGLPPSPINNPGKDAITAALFPEEHNLLYFVADGTGGHIFARTIKEHENNVKKYRAWRRNKNSQ
jgi:UPF0755 protein